MDAPGASDGPVPGLLAMLADTDRDRRHQALRELASLGPAAVDAIPALLLALQDDDLRVRSLAADALAAVGEAAVRPVVEAMLTPGPDHRRALLVVLGRIGRPAAAARSVIEAACSDPVLAPVARRARQQVCPTLHDRFSVVAARYRWEIAGLAGAIAIAGLLAVITAMVPESTTSGPRMQAVVALTLAGAAVGALGGGTRWGLVGAVGGALVSGIGGGFLAWQLTLFFHRLVGPLLEALRTG